VQLDLVRAGFDQVVDQMGGIAAACRIAKPFVRFDAFGNARGIVNAAITTGVFGESVFIVMIDRGVQTNGFIVVVIVIVAAVVLVFIRNVRNIFVFLIIFGSRGTIVRFLLLVIIVVRVVEIDLGVLPQGLFAAWFRFGSTAHLAIGVDCNTILYVASAAVSFGNLCTRYEQIFWCGWANKQ